MKRELTRAMRAVFSFSIPAMAVAAVLLAPARANPTLLITELSDTHLTVTLDGLAYGTVSNVGPDHWEWRSNLFGNAISFDANDGTYGFYHLIVGGYWAEPSDPTKANFVGLGTFDWNGSPDGEVNIGLVIYSGVSFGSLLGLDSKPISPNADGTVGFWNFNGKLNGNPVLGPFDVIYSDRNDAARVPEGASTIALLGLAAVGLIGAARVRAESRK